MAANMMRRFLGLDGSNQNPLKRDPSSTTSQLVPSKKRSHQDLVGNNEDEPSAVSVKRVKHAFVDLSYEDDDDTIAVAHRPLRELDPNQLGKNNVELSGEEYAHKVRRKLYVKSVLVDPEDVAEYSRCEVSKPATKTIPRKSRKPAAKSKSASVGRRDSKTPRKPAKERVLTDLRKLLGHKLSSPNLPSPSLAQDRDDGRDDIETRSVSSEAQCSRRGSRHTARKSYVDMDLAESEDELAASPVKLNKEKAKRRQDGDDDDDDFMAVDDHNEAAISDYSEEAELAHDLGESSEERFDEDEVDEDEEHDEDALQAKSTKAKKSRTVAKKASSDPATQPKKGSRKKMINLKNGNAEAKKINHTLPPMFEIEDIFHDMTSKARTLGLDKVVKGLNSRPIRVATMCSGTESPLLALEMIADCLAKSDLPMNLEIEHLFSAEIVPFKQAYIERNFNPPIIFRDITELTSVVDEDEPVATTAYGGKAPVPKQVDLVIAGTSCVDFSGLNTFQKDLDAGGESADTWNAVLSYCRVFRPAIVLLENVSGADWDRMLADYESIDYECSGASVNTRDYYLPQIRERGYMACFNKLLPGYVSGSAAKWLKLMAQFKRPASSPVSDFLLPSDQIVQRTQTIRSDAATKEVDWRQCMITQMEYRQDMRLGWARPITNWSESGQMLPPENGNTGWYHKQVERVLDTIDGAVLRKALSMYDCRFKTRIFDLSQNIHRETDHRPFGVAGCITPSGIYFVTDLGRVLTSEETLILQGLPLAKISFTTESQSEIQSLAGNAMSTTVIAASILSALIPGYGSIDTRREPRRSNDTVNQHKTANIASHATEIVSSSSGESFNLDSLLQKAEMANRRCYCEGSTGIAAKPIQQCRDCGHTTCTSCGGNPAHDYRQSNSISRSRLSPADFVDYVRSVVPLRLSFSSVTSVAFAKRSDNFNEAAASALAGSFTYSSTRRTHCWTIIYTSEDAVLELVISPADLVAPTRAQWRLYAIPSKALPSDSSFRRLLEQPVARSAVYSHGDKLNLLMGDWSLRVPRTPSTSIPLTIKPSGPKVASWWSRMEMPDFTQHTVSAFIDVRAEAETETEKEVAVSGRYQYLPRCGKACNSLYKRVSSTQQPMFLFLDPTRTAEPDADCFVFSQSVDVLERDEVRPVVARIDSSWRPWAKRGTSVAVTKTQLLIDELWHEVPSCSLRTCQTDLAISRRSQTAAVATANRCSELDVLLACELPFNLDIGDATRQLTISADNQQFFKTNAWIFEAMRRHLPAADWHELDNHNHAKGQACCNVCAPSRPALRWGLNKDGTELQPHEDPRGAALYERAMKSRPEPVVIVVSDKGSKLSLGLNIATLAHRAVSRIPADLSVSCQWRFVANAQPEFKFRPFKLTDTRGVLPYSKDLQMTIELFPQQLMSLSWMRQQEQGVPFAIEEIEEATTLDTLGWRAEVRATAVRTIRGGICADHPGFGKTITSLALIHSEFRESTSAKIQAELKPRANGYLPNAGTLIVCPASLIEQWVDEIHKKLGYGSKNLCVLKTVADLTKRTIAEFQEFKIVVVNRALFSNDTYIERLAAFAGIPGPVSNKGRLYTHWLKFAHEQIPKNLKMMRNGRKEFKLYIEKLYREHVQSDEFKAAVPSKRLTGAEYIAGKVKKTTVATKVKASSSVNTTHLDKPLLDMFYWNRVIVDEFHQTEAKLSNFAVVAMQADKRWGLSATPAMGDFYEVSRMGALIGVPLHVGSDVASGLMKSASVRELRKDMTSFELFDAMRQTPSDAMNSRIHNVDQKFLDTFVRQNIMDHNEMKFQDHLVPVALDLDHRALYTELSQHLNSAEMRIRKKTKATDREQRFNDAVSTSTSAEEALSKVAAFSHRKKSAASKSDTLDLHNTVRSRLAAVEMILSKLPIAMSEAKGTEDAFQSWVKSRLQDGTLGDAETCNQLLRLAKDAKAVKVSGAQLTARRKRSDDYGTGIRAFTAHLNGLCNRLLIEQRSARYMQNVQNLQQVAGDPGIQIECDSPSCNIIDSLDVAISALCGHTICRNCYAARRDSEDIKCPSYGCSSSMADHHLFWPSKLGQLSAATPYGAKIDAAVKLLKRIEAAGEQAILFVQFPNQLGEAEMALNDAGISATIVENVERAGLQIQSFREDAGTQQQRTVIVLNSSDETAAGSNLQSANHVIFLSPLLKDTQYGYDSTMAQTIGRVRRHGQNKEIHIYRIVALDTIDVDVLEQRERRSDALVEQGAPEIKRPRTLSSRSSAKERTQLIRGDDGRYSLQPQSWLIDYHAEGKEDANTVQKVKGKSRVLGYEDFSSIVKFSKNFVEKEDE